MATGVIIAHALHVSDGSIMTSYGFWIYACVLAASDAGMGAPW
jgi:hypothetical protein